MNRTVTFLIALIIGLTLGYFAGREHIKYELRSAFQSAATDMSDGLKQAFGGANDTSSPVVRADEPPARTEPDKSAEREYMSNNLELYDLSAKYMDSVLDGKVPGVLFKIRNTGDRSLDNVEVTVYFKDAQGNTIAEKDFNPVLVTEYAYGRDNKPLKPGYIWQMEKGKFYSAKSVPSEWREGSIEAIVTDLSFTP